jgi:hypothetical protein
VLPYSSYLRVYEPLAALTESGAVPHVDPAAASGVHTLDVEQRTALTRVVAPVALPHDYEHLDDAYALRRDGHTYWCPVDLTLRSWLSFTSLVDAVGDITANLAVPHDVLASAGDGFLQWRRDHPEAVPHIQQSTWGVPRTWFVMVVEDEREPYDAGEGYSVRYRARILDARRRLGAAQRVLHAVIDDADLLDELTGLATWLECFDDNSWVELDYAGIARLLGDRLATDSSARDIHRALDALRREDFASAGASYQAFEERWRVVNAYERAN